MSTNATDRESKVTEGRLKLQGSFGHGFHLVAEPLEALLQLVPELPLGLLGGQVVPVVHVLMLAQIGGDLSHLCVKLDVLGEELN